MIFKSLILDAEIGGIEFIFYGKVMKLRERVDVIELHLLTNYYLNAIRINCLNILRDALNPRRS